MFRSLCFWVVVIGGGGGGSLKSRRVNGVIVVMLRVKERILCFMSN